MLLVDANVLIYAANRGCEEHPLCLRLIERWRTSVQPWYTTWAVLYEFLKVVTHPRLLRAPLAGGDALAFVRALLASPSLEVLVPGERHEAILAETLAEVPDLSGGVFHDVHTAVLMREHGIRRIVTRDADFRRFGFLEVLDPLTLKA
ncbi:MAG TPA: TA system VapC family ribonuclease toxin [Planctomycetota bacterium]